MERDGRLLSRQFPLRRKGRGQKPTRVVGVPRDPKPRRVTGVVGLLAALVIVAGCGTGDGPRSGTSYGTGGLAAPPSARRLPVIAVTVPPGARPSPIPRSFLGISTEYWTMSLDERHAVLYKRVISMLHVRGDGPLALRIGGDSSDHALDEPPRLRLAHWAFALTSQFASHTARIVRALHPRLTEFNSVTCGGLRGVSNAFATALWAPDAIFELIRAGLGGRS